MKKTILIILLSLFLKLSLAEEKEKVDISAIGPHAFDDHPLIEEKSGRKYFPLLVFRKDTNDQNKYKFLNLTTNESLWIDQRGISPLSIIYNKNKMTSAYLYYAFKNNLILKTLPHEEDWALTLDQKKLKLKIADHTYQFIIQIDPKPQKNRGIPVDSFIFSTFISDDKKIFGYFQDGWWCERNPKDNLQSSTTILFYYDNQIYQSCVYFDKK